MRFGHRIFVSTIALPLILGASVYGQGPVNGKLVDSQTKAAVPFATIRLKSQALGVVSNADGDFQIPYRLKITGDSILVSCIGYITRRLSLKDLPEGPINTIFMVPSTTKLKEVVVKGSKAGRLQAWQVVARAIAAIPKNCQQMPYSYDAYYRDYQLKEGQYFNLNEAIVEIEDLGIETMDQQDTKIKLIEYKLNRDFQRDSATAAAYDDKVKFIPNATLIPFGGNELSILRVHDAIRNFSTDTYSYVYRLNKNFMENHTFRMDPIVYLDDVPLFSISFQSRSTVTGSKHVSRGRMLVQYEDFAIHKFEYSTFEKTDKDEKLLYDISVEYSRVGQKMYLNYISFNNFFKTRNPADFLSTNISIALDAKMLFVDVNHLPDRTTALDPENYRIKFEDKRLKVRSVEIHNEKTLVILFEGRQDVNFYVNEETLSKKMEIKFGPILDLAGKELNQITYLSVNQFRELFVQKVDPKAGFPSDSAFVRKNIPLSKNTLSPARINADYWMNTPLKKAQN